MQILVFNCGSSSLNYKVYRAVPNRLDLICHGKAHRVGVTGTESAFIEHYLAGDHMQKVIPIPDHQFAARLVISFLEENRVDFQLIGHRFVHGGSRFRETVWLTPDNEPDLLACLPLASIHNPNSMRVIRECQSAHPDIRQYLTFDTAFHASLPDAVSRYPLPQDILKKNGYRKYGFHGLSYQYVVQRGSEYLQRNPQDLRIVACHLGTGGSSAAAIQNGKSIDTTMGFTPLAGLMMSTRTGDLDPTLVLRLIDELEVSPAEFDSMLNKKSGLLGISGFSSDMRDIIDAMDQGNDRAALAFSMYTLRLRKTIGSLAVGMGGIDVLIFTDDIGAQNSRVREAACRGLAWCGILLDEKLNRHADPAAINVIGSEKGSVAILCMPTNEELVIAEEGFRLLNRGGR